MSLTPELRALAVITTATGLMWLPYVCARMQARGLAAIANIDPGNPPEPAWALRARRAHANAIENLAVFAPLVLIAAVAGISTSVTAAAANIFVAARPGALRAVHRRRAVSPHASLLDRRLCHGGDWGGAADAVSTRGPTP